MDKLKMLRKIFIATCLMMGCLTANAGTIEYNGYSRSADSNIVTGGGLEWLMWDQTRNYRVEEAANVGEGFRLASHAEIAGLFDAFKFGSKNWSLDENTYSQSRINHSLGTELSNHNAFFSLFGFTDVTSCKTRNLTADCYDENDPYKRVFALFGNGGDGLFSSAQIADDSLYYGPEINGVRLEIYNDHLTETTEQREYWIGVKSPLYGLALVRGITGNTTYVNVPSAINGPSPFSILMIFIVGFALRRYQMMKN